MTDDSRLRDRGRVDADLDVPAARPGTPDHAEWIIDEAVEETFPASDAPTPPRPGSLAALRYARAASGRKHDRQRARTRMLLCTAAVAVLAVLLSKGVRRRRSVLRPLLPDC